MSGLSKWLNYHLCILKCTLLFLKVERLHITLFTLWYNRFNNEMLNVCSTHKTKTIWLYTNPPSVGVYGDVVRVKILFNKKDTALIQFNDGQQAQTGTSYNHHACSFRVVQNLSDKWFRYSFRSGCTMQFCEIFVLWYFDGVCTFWANFLKMAVILKLWCT